MKIFVQFVIALCSAGLVFTVFAQSAGTKDTEIGIRKTNVLKIPAVPLVPEVAGDPGDNELLPRSFQGAPPQVPHLIEGMEITLKTNDCRDCHAGEEGEDGEPAISESHFTNVAEELLKGSQHVCVTCHVVQKDAKPLITNTFAKKD